MAQRQVTVFIDDVTGEELENGETVTFALDGVDYAIDLSEGQADELRKAFAPYVLKGRRTGGRYARGSGGSSSRSRQSSGSDSSPRKSGGREVDTKAVREWANAHGHSVSERGRIPASVVEAYEAAH